MNIVHCYPFRILYKYILNVYNNIKYYFYYSSIHGLSHAFRVKSWYGAVFWLSICLCGSVNFYYLLLSNIEVYDNQPVLRHIDTTAYPISLVPFPAVTICTFNFVYKPKSDKIKAILLENGIDEKLADDFFGNMALLKIPYLGDTSQYRIIYEILSANGYSNNEKLMEDLAQPCDNILQFCSWAGQQIDCSSMFIQSKAEMGLCCSFNSDLYCMNTLSPRKNNSNREYYSSAGPTFGLYVKFNMSTTNQVSPVFHANTIIVYVHEKATFAEESAFFSMIGPGREINMKITAEIFQAGPELQTININARKCLLDGEGSRVLNQHYSLANCMHLCKRNAIGNLCDCVPHFYPDLGFWDSCNLMDVTCLKTYELNYTALHMKSETHSNNNYPNGDTTCECLPSCSGIQYGGSLGTLHYQDLETPQEAAVRVYYQNNWCKKFIVIRSTTFDTFIALIGGMFALCLGGSLLSFVEFFYFILKSFFTEYKGQTRNDSTENLPELYWSELEIYRKNISVSYKRRPGYYITTIDNFMN